MAASQTPLLYTTRNEVDGQLNVVDGQLPNDIKGAVYVIYPVGSINSNGLPFPEFNSDGSKNQEYGTPVMNGDGMVLLINFNNTPVTVKSRLMKTPCFYADQGFPYKHGIENDLFAFKNWGIARISMMLGSRNEQNTAIIPVQFKGTKAALVSAYDVGRPFLLDASSLELKTPLGGHADWTDGVPSSIPWPFSLVMSTAHPTFDPYTQELFSVNFVRSMSSMFADSRVIFHLKNNMQLVKDKLSDFVSKLQSTENSSNTEENRNKLINFFENIDTHLGTQKPDSSDSASNSSNEVYLMRWTGNAEIEKWLLHDQNGNPIAIKQCMHQISISEDYVLLTDTSFKFTSDLMFNNFLLNDDKLDAYLRKLLTNPMLPYTICYIVKRKELTKGGGAAVAYTLQQNIPLETIHYSLNYKNPNGVITLYGAHNAAICVAEWMRHFDIAKISGQPVDPEVIGLFALGSMDVGRLGKWEIDAEKLTIDTQNSKVFAGKGNTDSNKIGPNSWNIGLYTYRDMISATTNVDTIEYLWLVSNGLDKRMLSEFIYDLYSDYGNRIVPANEMLSLTEKGIPCGITRIKADTMEPDDYYQFDFDTFPRSIQFVPRTPKSTIIPASVDGYIFCTVQIKNTPDSPIGYRSEFWLFDAMNVAQGPVCKLRNPHIQFCFTLHSTWLENADAFDINYNVSIKTDYNEVISALPKGDKQMIQFIFDTKVYPFFKN
jgi:carotenoid cleavage dioxygenase-like enzyme